MSAVVTDKQDGSANDAAVVQRTRSGRRLPFDTSSRGARWLAGLLGVQLVVAGSLAWQGSRNGDFAAAGPLLALEQDAVTRLTIADGTRDDSTPLALVRDGDGWSIESADSNGAALPADASRVGGMIDTLASLDAALPVASAKGSRAQLDVADDQFQRRVTLTGTDGTLADLYVGTSPGFRRAHVRQADSDAIRALQINVFDLPAERDEWLDKALLAVSEPTRIAGEDFALTRDGEAWTLEGDVPDGQELSLDAAAELSDTMSSLRVTGLALNEVGDDDLLPDNREESAAEVVVLTLDAADGQSRTLTLQMRDAVASVQRDDLDAVFALPLATAERLSELATRDALLVDVTTEDDDALSQPDSAASAKGGGDSPSG